VTEANGYADWRSLELAIKDAAKKAARAAGPGVSAATVDAQIRQARFDRFLSRVFAAGEQSEWLLKGGMSMLARVPRSRTTKDMDLASQQAPDLVEAERALAELVDVDHDTQIDTVQVDVVVGPPPVGRPEVVEPANRLHLRRRLVTHPYRLYPVPDQIADKVCATMDTNYPGGKRSSTGTGRTSTPRPPCHSQTACRSGLRKPSRHCLGQMLAHHEPTCAGDPDCGGK
jgi:hypothetical protein